MAPKVTDLTLPEFFASGVVQDATYSTKPTSINQLRNEIVKAFQLISPELCRSVEFRLDKCIRVNDWHIEQDLTACSLHYFE
jgi:hypothetical protein